MKKSFLAVCIICFLGCVNAHAWRTVDIHIKRQDNKVLYEVNDKNVEFKELDSLVVKLSEISTDFRINIFATATAYVSDIERISEMLFRLGCENIYIVFVKGGDEKLTYRFFRYEDIDTGI
ncbi:MAG: hypothetical protein EOM12_14875 [Verrucomicrobiae bacterium]|nr:hypothetical protein [Verrucomicrobiae bacterium]